MTKTPASGSSVRHTCALTPPAKKTGDTGDNFKLFLLRISLHLSLTPVRGRILSDKIPTIHIALDYDTSTGGMEQATQILF